MTLETRNKLTNVLATHSFIELHPVIDTRCGCNPRWWKMTFSTCRQALFHTEVSKSGSKSSPFNKKHTHTHIPQISTVSYNFGYCFLLQGKDLFSKKSFREKASAENTAACCVNDFSFCAFGKQMPPFWGSPSPVCHGGSVLISKAQRLIVTQAERRSNIIQADEKQCCDMKNGT